MRERPSLSQTRSLLEDAAEDAGKVVIRCLGPLYVLAANAAILFIATSMVLVVYPRVLAGQPVANRAVHLIFLASTVGSVLWNYYACASVGPGYSLTKIQDPEAGHRTCKKCGCAKPEGCHHCSVCDKCVLGMDHHCPWMNTCVGRDNYAYFLRFLSSCWLGTAYTAAVSSVPIELVGMAIKYRKKDSGAHLSCYLLSLGVLIGITLLLGLHLYLASTGQTTISLVDKFASCETWREVARKLCWEQDFSLGNLRRAFAGRRGARGRAT